MVVGRIQPPVQDYAHPEAISSGKITDKFGLKTEDVVDASTRKQNEFCPCKKTR